MKVLILTSSDRGTASVHLPALLGQESIEIVGVVLSSGEIRQKWKFLWRKLKKIRKIGIAGALNGRKLRQWFHLISNPYLEVPSLQEICMHAKIPMLLCSSVNGEDCRQFIAEKGAELGISLGNGYIAPRIFNTPALGMINIHHETLPDYQNAQPIIWQIYNGSGKTGYTIHRIDKNIDTGAILWQEEMPLEIEDTLEKTVKKNLASLMQKSAAGLLKTLLDFDTVFKHSKAQGPGKSYTTPTLREFHQMQSQFQTLKNEGL